MRSPLTRSVLSWMALVLAAPLLAGCGGETPPAEAAPELADRLALIDRAVASGDETAIRRRVDSLVAATESARDGGRIDEAQADRILTAADALLARLPAPELEPSPSPPTTTATPPAPEDGEGDKGTDEGDKDEKKAREEEEKRRKELEKQREEAEKREEEAKKQEEREEREEDDD